MDFAPVHTHPDIFKDGEFFSLQCTRKRRFRAPKTQAFKNVPQSGGFRKRRLIVCVRTKKEVSSTMTHVMMSHIQRYRYACSVTDTIVFSSF